MLNTKDKLVTNIPIKLFKFLAKEAIDKDISLSQLIIDILASYHSGENFTKHQKGYGNKN